MEEYLERLISMRNIYIGQVNKLKKNCKYENIDFEKKREYKIQLNMWEKRITQYSEKINELNKSK